ncbi:hypothetical protein AHMF7605_21120 [Adhaeribacter arboris]|uniref:Transposase n=1 Tax=Adhaeribacter arboris TaxID=2072846 RepID=A0A2T2YJY6_9BACT|nr:hypothetical protein AHMF7605_21120 [Adhaeribacter arboris]
MSQGAFYKWRPRYNGIDATELTRLKEQEEENRRLKATSAGLKKSFKALPKATASG